MMDIIGTNAGQLWHALDKATEPLDLKSLRTASGIRTERDTLLALGWLAKEGKVIIEPSGRSITVALIRE